MIPSPAQQSEAKTARASPSKSTYQPSLFNVRSGPSRMKRKQGSQEDDDKASKDDSFLNKRTKSEAEEDLSEVSKGSGTTVITKELLPVSREAFVRQYQVEGLQSVYYQRDWIDAKTAHRWHTELKGLKEWYRPKLKVYGREIQQSRSIAGELKEYVVGCKEGRVLMILACLGSAFATSPGLELKYSGHQVEMHAPFPPLLETIAARLSTDDCLGAQVKFNHAMLNSYEDGQVYIGRHSDNLENKVIVTVSLGAPRSWIMEEKKPRGAVEKGKRHRWMLENGSLLVMQGSVQKDYTHEIPKEPKVKDSRIVSR
jgi:alkylated DNA repair dioxygenase AlkB